MPELTRRQNEVLRLIAEGYPDKLIASALGISRATVRLHISAAALRLGEKGRIALALAYFAGRHGIARPKQRDR